MRVAQIWPQKNCWWAGVVAQDVQMTSNHRALLVTLEALWNRSWFIHLLKSRSCMEASTSAVLSTCHAAPLSRAKSHASFCLDQSRNVGAWGIRTSSCVNDDKMVNTNRCKLSYQYLLGNSRLTLHYPNLKLLEFAWCWRIPGHHCHQMILASCIRRPSRLKLCPWSAGHLADHRLGPCLHIVSPSDKPRSQMRKLYHLCRLKQDVSVVCPWIALNTHRWAYTLHSLCGLAMFGDERCWRLREVLGELLSTWESPQRTAKLLQPETRFLSSQRSGPKLCPIS